jgi:hypothetical protein
VGSPKLSFVLFNTTVFFSTTCIIGGVRGAKRMSSPKERPGADEGAKPKTRDARFWASRSLLMVAGYRPLFLKKKRNQCFTPCTNWSWETSVPSFPSERNEVKLTRPKGAKRHVSGFKQNERSPTVAKAPNTSVFFVSHLVTQVPLT